MRTTFLHASPAYELTARLDSTPYGHHLQLLSFVPTARRPEPQVKYQVLLSREQLIALRSLIDAQLQDTAQSDAESRGAGMRSTTCSAQRDVAESVPHKLIG